MTLLPWLSLLLPFAAMAQPAPPDVARLLAPSGTLRAAINLGNSVLAQPGPEGGEPRGVSVALARALAQRLGVPVQFVPFAGAGLVTDALAAGAWDICFLAIDPVRAKGIAFTAPYVLIEGAYLVPQDSPLTTVDQVDRPGVTIEVDRGSAYDLFLTRELKHAQLVRPTPPTRAAQDYLAHPKDVLAGVRQPLVALAAANPGYRMVPGRFMVIEQAVGTPQGREAALGVVKAFVEEMKASGFVAAALAESAQPDAEVAPAAAGNG